MPKHTPKTAPLTQAGQDLRERQGFAARSAKGARKPKRVSVAAKAVAGKPVTERNQGVTAEVDQLGPVAAELVHPAPRFTFPPPAEPAPAPPPPAPGTYRIDQLRQGQCRFACTPDRAPSHRFCGARTEIGPGNRWGAWCPEHLPHVLSSGGAGWKSRAEVAAKAEGVVA